MKNTFYCPKCLKHTEHHTVSMNEFSEQRGARLPLWNKIINDAIDSISPESLIKTVLNNSMGIFDKPFKCKECGLINQRKLNGDIYE